MGSNYIIMLYIILGEFEMCLHLTYKRDLLILKIEFS